MFSDKYKRLDEDISVINYQGVFKKRLTLFQAVALIVSGTIGAGVLSIPYAVSKVGLNVGLLYIVFLGLLMLGLNLLLGYVVVRAKEKFQLVGLARKYLGRSGEVIMTVIMYAMLFGIMVVYIIGEGEVLSALFGGDSMAWSLIFFILFSMLIVIGMRGIKTVEFFLSLSLLFVILIIGYFSLPHLTISHITYHDLAYLLFPYGVILFSFHGTNSVPEAHALLRGRDNDFKKAIIISGLVCIVAYALFALVVVGVTGSETTEIATIGLGEKVGQLIFLFGNIFAIIAMGSSFLMAGLSLRDSLRWDYKMPTIGANTLVLSIPLLIFLLGLRQFTAAIDIVGGVIISFEMMFIILIYWRAKQTGDIPAGKYKLHHTLLLAILLIIVLAIGAIYSVVKLF